MPEKSEIESFLDGRIEHFPDKSARWLFEDKEFVRGLVEIIDDGLAEFIDFSQIVQVNRSYIFDDLRELESDMVFRVPFRSESDIDELLIYILIEHQSTVDPIMGFRVLYYMMQIWDSQRREWELESVPKSRWRFNPIVPIVFYTGDQRWTTPLTLNAIMDIPDALSRFVPKIDPLFISVKETDESKLTHTGHPLGWVLTVLQQEGATVEALSETLIEALSHINTLDEASARQRRRAISYLLLLILNRRSLEEHPELTNLFEQHVVHESDREETERMAQTIVQHHFERGIEQGIERGIEQGRTQGIEQGKEQGSIKVKQSTVLKVLHLRFNTVPELIADNISLIRSQSRLDSLLEQAVSAKTLDEIDLGNFDN